MARGYQQECPIARALDVVGDRWVLLILRELTLGPRWFTDLRLALAGIAPNLLSDRLRALEDDGLVERKVLEPPAARTVYVATDRALEAVPVLDALARFGASELESGDRQGRLNPHRAIRWLVVAFHSPEAGVDPFHARLWVDDMRFDLVTSDGELNLSTTDDGPADLDVHVTVDDLVAARRGAPLRLPPGPASARFARLFGFSSAMAGVAG